METTDYTLKTDCEYHCFSLLADHSVFHPPVVKNVEIFHKSRKKIILRKLSSQELLLAGTILLGRIVAIFQQFYTMSLGRTNNRSGTEAGLVEKK